MKVTLKDIADHVNVSVSTVSRVLNNGTTSISKETIDEINKVSKELGYLRLSDRKKEKISKKKIGCFLHNLKGKYQDPFYSEIIYGIERELLDQGFILNFTYDQSDLMNLDFSGRFEDETLGVIIVGPLEKNILKELSSQVPYVISVGGKPELTIDYVTVDFFKAAITAVDHLINLGHKRIACISASAPNDRLTEKEDDRFLGYECALIKQKLPIKSEWIQDGHFTIEGGYSAMKNILKSKEHPTAVFVVSDQMAHGAYRAIQEEGLAIPANISVVSFDDLEMSQYINPPLSSVRIHKEDMGRIAVKMLLQRMDEGIRLPLTSYLPTELVVRKSCGRLIL